MEAARIQSRAVFKVAAVALLAIGAALLFEHVVVEVRTTIRWAVAAIFVALALSPAVELVERPRIRGRNLPRWLAILVTYVIAFVAFGLLILHVIPPIVSEAEGLGSKLPTYVKDFEDWAKGNEEFRELNDKYDITHLLSQEASQLPSKLGDAANAAKSITVGLLNNVVEAVIVLTLAFFLLLNGGTQAKRLMARLRPPHDERALRVATRIAGIVRSYVSINLLLAALAGVFTWAVLELLGADLALPLGVLVGFLDLVPLIGFTVGGLLVAVVAALHSFPGGLIVWVIAFLVYQQLQDRVIQPLFYGRAVQIQPAVAIVAVLAGAQLAGILGALLAIPIAASIGVIIDELWPGPDSDDQDEEPAAGAAEASPAAP